jgi:hypothetical protein
MKLGLYNHIRQNFLYYKQYALFNASINTDVRNSFHANTLIGVHSIPRQLTRARKRINLKPYVAIFRQSCATNALLFTQETESFYIPTVFL